MAAYDISENTQSVYCQFNEIRGKSKADIPFRFWDVVVLTASDKDQKFAYELQLKKKLLCHEIPSGLPYLVFSDPPGPKIGCGGATMFVIQQLSEIYKDELDKLLVLIINAGGQSQRLPSASALGKIFTVLPFGDPPWQLLELKLACYIPFLPRMGPGFFHVASDTIEVFDVGNEVSVEDWNFFKPGLTALAHPSPLKIGTTHGVFVLKNDKNASCKLAEFKNCIEVLQKPTIETMTEREAVVRNSFSFFSLEEFVYTDSCFFFDHCMSKKLLAFYNEMSPLQCEIDGYGDFMQSLGPNATDRFATDVRNVSRVNPSLVETRKKLFLKLQGTPLNVIVLNASKFYHLGTMTEYLENFDVHGELATYISFVTNTCSGFYPKLDTRSITNDGCLIHSFLNLSCTVGRRSIVEYCDFRSPVDIGDNCIISCCSYGENQSSISIPNDLFMHTIEFTDKTGSSKYVTLVFHINDNIKKKASGSQGDALSSVLFLEKPLSRLNVLNGQIMFDKDDADHCPTFSLWYARIFPVNNTKESSFQSTLHLARSVLKLESAQDEQWTSECLLSAYEAMRMKDVGRMMCYRKELLNNIKSSKLI